MLFWRLREGTELSEAKFLCGVTWKCFLEGGWRGSYENSLENKVGGIADYECVFTIRLAQIEINFLYEKEIAR